MQRIVINTCFGGFSLSREATQLLADRGNEKAKASCGWADKMAEAGKPWYDEAHHLDIKRDDPGLVKVVGELGKDADGAHAKLRIVEVPDEMQWRIEEYDGLEHVAEDHRVWY